MTKIINADGEIVEMENPQIVRYGFWLDILDVTRINETYGNQTIVESIKHTDYAKMLEFTGGNVSITITGYMRGSGKRRAKQMWENIRNAQAAIAHIPGEVPTLGLGIGNAILWTIAAIFFHFFSDMCFQTCMVIKTMEFEDSPDHRGMYAFSITLEKLSWGIVQFVLDLVVNNIVGEIYMANHVVNNAAPLQMCEDLQNNLAGIENPIGDVVSALPSSVDSSFDVGQEVVTISDDSQDFPNYPEKYIVKPDMDRTLEWRQMPFLTSFPQSFSFQLGEHRYDVYFAVYDKINDDDVVETQLRAEIKKNDEYIYLGKIMPGMQYVFDTSLSIYLYNFETSVTEDGFMTFSINGMVADSS